MNKYIFTFFFISLTFILSCTNKNSLKSVYKPNFTIGVAVDVQHLIEDKEIILQHFNRLTAENVMKAATIQPIENQFQWEEADALANFARKNKMTMTGHALLWHQQVPPWFFKGLKEKDPQSIKIIKQRLKDHIYAMVERYDDVVDNWDVVNEAISDTPSKIWRDASEGSQWYRYFGNEEYIYWAFHYAYNALESQKKGNAKGKLYYNDYNTPKKIDKILQLALWLRDVKNIPIDGIGVQAHWSMYGPSPAVIDKTIQKIIDAGFKVKISELDVSVYNDYTNGKLTPQKEKDLTKEVEQQQAQYYADIFKVFKKHSKNITSVTFWGISDDKSWLLSFPVKDRLNYPLLFNFFHEPKLALESILKLQ